MPPTRPLAAADIDVGARVFTIGFCRVDEMGVMPGFVNNTRGPTLSRSLFYPSLCFTSRVDRGHITANRVISPTFCMNLTPPYF